jgi:hypothetical protein
MDSPGRRSRNRVGSYLQARKEAGNNMNLGQTANSIIISLACCGVMMQTTPGLAGPPKTADSTTARVRLDDAPASAERSAAKKVVQPAAIDVAMNAENKITGRVFDAQQNGVANTPVLIHQGKVEVARTMTDAEGRFEFANLKGGAYLISANNGHGLFRLWTQKSAPPAAHDQVLLVSQAIVIRAQNQTDGGEVLYDENGQPYARVHVIDNGAVVTGESNPPPVGSGGLCCLDIFTIALVATSLTALGIAIHALNEPDDGPASP